MCYWDEMLTEEECESALGGPNCEDYLRTLVKPPEVKEAMRSLISGDPHKYYHVCKVNVKEECRI